MTQPALEPTRAARMGVGSFIGRIILPIIVLGAALAVSTALAADARPTEISTLLLRIGAGVVVTALVVATLLLLVRLVARAPLREYGLVAGGFLSFGLGVLAWLLPAAASFAVLALLGAPLTVTGTLAELAGVGALVFLAVLLSEAVPEELVFRGYVLGVLRERAGAWPAIITQAALFVGLALLLRGYTGVNDLMLFIGMGIGLGYLRVLTGSVWTAVGFHVAFQTGAQLVLTHGVISFAGSQSLGFLALGAIPFGVGAILLTALVAVRPELFPVRDSQR